MTPAQVIAMLPPPERTAGSDTSPARPDNTGTVADVAALKRMQRV